MSIVKPGQWAASRAGVSPTFQRLWDDLIEVWPLWGDATTVYGAKQDDHTGSLTSGVTWAISPHGRTLDFDGLNGTEVNLGDKPEWSLGISGKKSSIFMVVKPRANDDDMVLVSVDQEWSFRQKAGASTPYLRVDLFGDNTGTAAEIFTLNEWHTTGFVWDVGTSVKVFLDGDPTYNDYSSTDTSAEVGDVLMFGNRSGFSVNLDGQIALVAMWDRLLSDAEIRLLDMDPFGIIRPASLTTDPIEFDPQAWFQITDLPADFGTAEAASITTRVQGANFTAESISLYAQLFQSDESTPLSDEVLCHTMTTDEAANNVTVSFTGLDTSADKAVWDNALVRFRWSST